MISVHDPTLLESGATAEFPALLFSLRHLLPSCVGEFLTFPANVVVLCLVVILLVRYLRSPWRSVPPGPRGLPIIGNVLEARNKAWLFKEDCQKRYSGLSFSTHVVLRVDNTPEEMVYLNALGQPVLIIHNLKAASDLLHRRAHIYSSRPHLIMAHEILAGGSLPSFISYGEEYVCCSPL
jgi:fumarate reductase subunit C